MKLETTDNTLAFHNDDLQAFQKHNEVNYPRFHREFNELKNKYQEQEIELLQLRFQVQDFDACKKSHAARHIDLCKEVSGEKRKQRELGLQIERLNDQVATKHSVIMELTERLGKREALLVSLPGMSDGDVAQIRLKKKMSK